MTVAGDIKLSAEFEQYIFTLTYMLDGEVYKAYDRNADKAMPVADLIAHFEKSGTEGVNAACGKDMEFTAEEWKGMSPKEKSDTLMNYRIAFLADTMVNWCPKLGTVLAVGRGTPGSRCHAWDGCVRVAGRPGP